MAKKIGVMVSGGEGYGLYKGFYTLHTLAKKAGYEVIAIPYGWRGLVAGWSSRLSTDFLKEHQKDDGSPIISCRDYNPHNWEECRLDLSPKAYEFYQALGLHALFYYGGDGSDRNALEFVRKYSDMNLIGIPCTIDGKEHSVSDYNEEVTGLCIGQGVAASATAASIHSCWKSGQSMGRFGVQETQGRNRADLVLLGTLEAVLNGTKVAAVIAKDFNFHAEEISKILFDAFVRDEYPCLVVSESFVDSGVTYSAIHQKLTGAGEKAVSLIKPLFEQLCKAHYAFTPLHQVYVPPFKVVGFNYDPRSGSEQNHSTKAKKDRDVATLTTDYAFRFFLGGQRNFCVTVETDASCSWHSIESMVNAGNKKPNILKTPSTAIVYNELRAHGVHIGDPA